MSTYNPLTVWFTVGVVTLITVFDFYQFYKGGLPATISDMIIRVSTKTIFVPFAFGVLMGHLFA